MAKKKNKKEDVYDIDKDEKGKSGGSKILTFLIALLIIIIWLAVFALFIKLDIGGFGSNVLRPILKDVPIINKILPQDPNELEDTVNDVPVTGDYYSKYKTLDEAIAKIQELEDKINSMQDKATNSKDSISDLKAENKRLKKFEKQQAEFEELRKQYEEEVVFGDSALDYTEYMKYYESIEPEHAAELYSQAVKQQQESESIQESADRYAAMEPEKAAAIFDTMTGDLDLISRILSSMKSKNAAAIIQEMDQNMAAKVTKKMDIMAQE